MFKHLSCLQTNAHCWHRDSHLAKRAILCCRQTLIAAHTSLFFANTHAQLLAQQLILCLFCCCFCCVGLCGVSFFFGYYVVCVLQSQQNIAFFIWLFLFVGCVVVVVVVVVVVCVVFSFVSRLVLSLYSLPAQQHISLFQNNSLCVVFVLLLLCCVVVVSFILFCSCAVFVLFAFNKHTQTTTHATDISLVWQSITCVCVL